MPPSWKHRRRRWKGKSHSPRQHLLPETVGVMSCVACESYNRRASWQYYAGRTTGTRGLSGWRTSDLCDRVRTGYSASRSSAAARSSSSSAKLFSRSAAGSPIRPRARRRACSARSRSAAGVSAQRGDRGGIVRETHGEKLSLRITNLCYWTRRRPATCSARRRAGYSGHGNSAPAPDDRFYPIGQSLHREWLGQ